MPTQPRRARALQAGPKNGPGACGRGDTPSRTSPPARFHQRTRPGGGTWKGPKAEPGAPRYKLSSAAARAKRFQILAGRRGLSISLRQAKGGDFRALWPRPQPRPLSQATPLRPRPARAPLPWRSPGVPDDVVGGGGPGLPRWLPFPRPLVRVAVAMATSGPAPLPGPGSHNDQARLQGGLHGWMGLGASCGDRSW